VEFEQRKLFVYKARVEGGPQYLRFDYNRDGDVDLYDFARFQDCFTGSEPDPPVDDLSPNCQRLNAYDDRDCEIDLDDWHAMFGAFEAGGPE
jgi:hypothetical protein